MVLFAVFILFGVTAHATVNAVDFLYGHHRFLAGFRLLSELILMLFLVLYLGGK